MKKLRFHNITFGCDPEFFFRKDNEIVGAEKILPRSGLMTEEDTSKIIIDGVQAELNPGPTTCREVMARSIMYSFVAVRDVLKQHARTKIDFAQTIKLGDEDFEKLSDDSKKFGCMPSKNAYNGGMDGKITIDPTTHRYRSAGGHLHIGNGGSPFIRKVLNDATRVIQMMDILVGNTCVLIDRDPGNIERRKVYGRAGEFRIPPHGVEYRTLSNFWLRSYQLMSLVMGLARHAVIIVANDMDGKFVEKVNMEDIAKAINTNDFALALRNFKRILPLLMEITPITEDYPINPGNINHFKYFVKKGLDHWFKEDPLEHWCDFSHESLGFCDFSHLIVGAEMRNDNG